MGREAGDREVVGPSPTKGTMKPKEIYRRVAGLCERAAATAIFPETKAGTSAAAVVWRRLANAVRPSEGAGSDILADEVAVMEDLEARSFSASSISGSKD